MTVPASLRSFSAALVATLSLFLTLALTGTALAQTATTVGPGVAPSVSRETLASKFCVTDFVLGPATQGGTASVTFTVDTSKCGQRSTELSLTSYSADAPTYTDQQVLFDAQTRKFKSGTYTMTVRVPAKTAADASNCPNEANRDPETSGHGANTSGAYDSTCDGRPSGNGNGGGNANGRPCAGCVGNADNKNPPGQAPDGTDHNNGYECDGNSGIARENPAHTGCASHGFYQIDFVGGAPLEVLNKEQGLLYSLQGRLLGYLNG